MQYISLLLSLLILSSCTQFANNRDYRIPPPPPKIHVAVPGNNVVTLNWDAAFEDFYTVYWDTTPQVSRQSRSYRNITPPFTHSKVSNNKTYYYRLSATNRYGESKLSPTVSATPNNGNVYIKTPRRISIHPGNSQCTIQWETVPQATSYVIYYNSQKGVSGSSKKIIQTGNRFIHRDLPNGVEMYYRVGAFKDGISSTLSPELSTTIGTAPAPQLDAQLSSKKITLMWKDSPGALSYNLYWSDKRNISKQSTVEKNILSPFTLNNLKNNTPYYFRISAVNSLGEGPLSEELSFTPNFPPLSPTHIKVIGSNLKNTITWTHSQKAHYHTLYWSTKKGVNENSRKIEFVTSPYVHHTGINDKPIYYRLSATNKYGTSTLTTEYSGTPYNTDAPPKTPTGIIVLAGSRTNVITWEKSLNVHEYHLYWSESPAITKQSQKFIIDTDHHENNRGIIHRERPIQWHKGLLNGKNYYYAVSALNDFGESKLSPIVYGMPNPLIASQYMKKIPAKNNPYTRGDDSSFNDNEKPAHTVILTHDFYMDSTEVTQEEYINLLGVSPAFFRDDKKPVEKCTWFDAAAYCNARSKLYGLDTVYSYTNLLGQLGVECEMIGLQIHYERNGFRIPTEAEWEFACRAGSTTPFYWGDTINDDYAWYMGNSSWETHQVAQKKPNAFGLYDMLGNVWEWCGDLYEEYSEGSHINPKGATNGRFYSLRGGSFENPDSHIHSTVRDAMAGNAEMGYNGFRSILVIKQ